MGVSGGIVVRILAFSDAAQVKSLIGELRYPQATLVWPLKPKQTTTKSPGTQMTEWGQSLLLP